ncbi:uncharacterized protein LOC136067574 [Quercus suber]|uniref:uncharacterized protein LOC136063614 n=1 Tax=Quercus suber TaxID=58331 RepID=UPI000CE20B02|nr:uncharacterized protein LOC111993652 [Quercus suber]
MQILWREVFGGDRPITVDEFLYCYKPSEIHQSPGFYQFTARSKDCRLVRSLASSDRKWKTEFFFVSGFWAGNPSDVGRDSFGHFSGDLGNLRPEAVGRPTLSKLHRDRVHRARLYADRDFHTLVSLRRLAKWGFGPQPSDVALAHEITVRKRMATMRGNKGKEVGEGNRPEIDRQVRPTAGEKRKTISKNLDLENLPSRRGKKVKHGSSQVTKPTPSSQQPTRVYEVDSSTPVESTPSKTPPSKTAPSSSQPSQGAPSNIIENEDLAWERFKSAVTDEDINVCYDMSLKDFEHSGVHDLLKGMSKFIAASRQATGLDKTRILLETRIRELKEEAKQWAEAAAKTTEEAKGLQALVEELKANAAEKDARLEDLQRRTDEQSILLSRAKEDAVAEFKASKQYTDALDTNYAAGFEDFRIDAAERFPDVDFSSIMLNLNPATTSSLLGLDSEDANIEDDATTQPQDGPNPDAST